MENRNKNTINTVTELGKIKMKRLFLLFIFIAFTANVNAGYLCDMYGKDDILCESEKLKEIFILKDKCSKGDTRACKILDELEG